MSKKELKELEKQRKEEEKIAAALARYGLDGLRNPQDIQSVRNIIAAQEIMQYQLDFYKELPDFDEGWFIFGGPKKLPDNTVRNVANKAQKDAKLPHSRLHDLRHAHASVLLENLKGEGDILKVSKRLGHSSVATTMNIYAHILDKSETEVVDVLDNLF